MTRGLFVNRDGGVPGTTELGGHTDRGMGRLTIILVGALGLAVLGGCLFLAYGNFPVPSAPVEKVLPDARFPK
jgi:hypothetical protein